MKVAKSPWPREGVASIGSRLALDDSAIDGHTQNGNVVHGEYRSEQVAT